MPGDKNEQPLTKKQMTMIVWVFLILTLGFVCYLVVKLT